MNNQSSFYITLTSDSSLADYPNNKTSNFTVNLPSMISLESDYEVSIVEILYPHSIENITEGNNRLVYQYKLINKNKKVLTKEISFDLEIGHYKTLEDILRTLNEKISHYLKTIDAANEVFFISQNGKINLKEIERDNFITKINENLSSKLERDLIILPHRLYFENALALILGFDPFTHNLIKQNCSIHHPSIKFGISGEILIYTNLTEPIIFGHK